MGATAIGALLPALFILLSGHTLVWRDTSKLFQPVRTLIVESLRNLELPLWNPHEALGIPLFAQMMHGVLHPVSVAGAFLFPHAGMDVFVLVFLLLAALGSAQLARVLGAAPGAASVAGLGYGLSGYVLGMASVMQYLCAAATAPWALIGLRWAGEGRRFGTAIAAAALACLYFAGDPQWAIVVMLLGTALAGDAGGLRGLRSAAIGIAIGTALAGIQLIPTMAYLNETARATELGSIDRLQWALAPWRIIEFFVPGFFGSPGAGSLKWPVFLWLGGQTQEGLEMPFVPSVFVGAGILFLAARGLGRSRLTRILGIASLVCLWLALGGSAGAEQILHAVPVWGKFRYAEKMVGPLTLLVSILAAFGVEHFSDAPSRSWAVFAGICGLAALLIALALARWSGFDHAFAVPTAEHAVAAVRHNLIVGLVHAGLILVASASLVWTALRDPRIRTYVPVVAAGLVFLQSSCAAPFAMHSGNRTVLDEHPMSAIANTGELIRIVTPMEKNMPYPEGLSQYDAQIGAQSHLGTAAYNIPSRIDQLNTYTGLRPRRFDVLLRTFNEQFGFQSVIALRLFSTTHAIVKTPYFADETQIAEAATQDGTRVFVNPKWDFSGWEVPHRPWAIFAEQAALASDEQDALDMVVRTLAREESTVVLEGARLPGKLGKGRILAAARGSRWLRIEATSPADGILVVNDAFWPGWNATIDGVDVPIWRADYLVRAVPWPSGRHVLEMRYEPREVTMGWLLSLSGALALTGQAGLARRRAGGRNDRGETR